MDSYCIRRLGDYEAEPLAALRTEALTCHPLAFGAHVPDDQSVLIDNMRSRLDQGDEAAIFGAFFGTELVGMVGVVRNTGLKERHKAFIWGMYVNVEHRRIGVGEQLLRTAIAESGSWVGVELLHLSVTENAPNTQRLYERIGFQAWGREPRALCWEGRYVDEIYMILHMRDSALNK